ncbi:MAG TPA: hypothetical protein VJ779_03760, partial [Acetobacteraceae bacterium]|nr:hypothetical protein [Acetobacteraceae bacterium]
MGDRMLAFIAAAALSAAVAAAPVGYELPPETAALAPGPNLSVAQANCLGCHSADYITTQPRALPDPKAFWTAEVTKMQKAYGAPIASSDVPMIVDYLVS